MANWTGFSMTNRGAALQAKVNTGSTTLTFTKLAIGSGEASGSIESLTELAHKEIDMPIKGISNDGNIVTIKSTITNSGISQAFYAREMGLYAQDPDLGEILYAIQIDPNPDNIPASGSATVVSEEFEAHLIMSNTGNVSAVLDSSALVTLGDLDKHNESEDSHPDIRKQITDDIEAHNVLEAAHPAMDFIKYIAAASDGLHYRTRNGESDQVLDIINQLQTTLTQGTVPSGNKGTLFSLLSGIVHQIAALSGKANWWETPKDSFETLSAGIVAGDVSNPNSWWVKLGGTIPLIIQGITNISGTVGYYTQNFPISFPDKCFLAIPVTFTNGAELGRSNSYVHYPLTVSVRKDSARIYADGNKILLLSMGQ